MTPVLAWACGVLALAVAALAAVATVRGRRLDDRLLIAVAVLEAALLVQAVVGFVALALTDRSVDGVVFGSYLVTTVLVPPVGAFWALGEKSRWGTGVLLVAALTTAILVVRLEQVWSTGA
ncbi:MAG: hypothetical protein PGN11_10220 [Quadrisphaera sp.]